MFESDEKMCFWRCKSEIHAHTKMEKRELFIDLTRIFFRLPLCGTDFTFLYVNRINFLTLELVGNHCSVLVLYRAIKFSRQSDGIDFCFDCKLDLKKILVKFEVKLAAKHNFVFFNNFLQFSNLFFSIKRYSRNQKTASFFHRNSINFKYFTTHHNLWPPHN